MENIGKRFGHRVIIAVAKRKSYGWKRYVVRCDCGSESEVEFSSLKKGKSTQCGLCARRLKRRLIKIGTRYGTWTVSGNPKSEKHKGITRLFYPCTCECGSETYITACSLRSTRSVGCLACKINSSTNSNFHEAEEEERYDLINDLCNLKPLVLDEE